MAKPRRCPHCKVSIGKNFSFDENLNLLCAKCGKIAFPVTEEANKTFFHPIPFEKQIVIPTRLNKKVD